MKKYITIDDTIFEATLVTSTTKTNDEFVPQNRKQGTGGDKNHFFVGNGMFSDFEKFFPLIMEDKKIGLSNRNIATIKNYFSIANILNDLEFINQEIESKYLSETKINITDFSQSIFSIAQEQGFKTCFYIESKLSSAGNGIGFKEWNSKFNSTIKLLLLHTTKTKVYLFNNESETSSFFEFQQHYDRASIAVPTTTNSAGSQSGDKQKLIQKIFYGAPGTGKSHKVKLFVEGKEDRTERVTFHPEYDYSSFVGSYKPTMADNIIRYEFVPQAFINMYIKAWNDQDNDYYLVIEEINRGNCAEIFGDIFQLLDRHSDYDISPSKELKEFLLNNDDGLQSSEYGLLGGKLKLPPNLNILATMNTSDQSLFPMDSAFKRRWDWEYVPINYKEKYLDSQNIERENDSFKYMVQLEGKEEFSWISFIEAVNKVIKVNDNLGMDKCLGNYFIKSESESIELSQFINKAIFYLWNDVFKDEMEENNIFQNKTTYEDFFPIDPNGIEKLREILLYLDVKIETKE